MNSNEFAKEAIRRLGISNAARGGRVMYMEPSVLRQKSRVYYLGINPRDKPSSIDPDHHSLRSIERDLELFALGEGTNAFLDEQWAGMPVGTAVLQKRVVKLLRWAGAPTDRAVRGIPASNAAFFRSEQQPSTKEFERWVEACWPVHELVLDVTQARNVVVGGTSAGKAIVEVLGGNPMRPDLYERLSTANYSLSRYQVGPLKIFVLPPVPRWSGMLTVDAERVKAFLAAVT